uniref:(northern house mosquito) hypothetical protein n=1 Tax=Culex pipiens TaxID=7175 RepID=A0A8D8BZY6_CULPI
MAWRPRSSWPKSSWPKSSWPGTRSSPSGGRPAGIFWPQDPEWPEPSGVFRWKAIRDWAIWVSNFLDFDTGDENGHFDSIGHNLEWPVPSERFSREDIYRTI